MGWFVINLVSMIVAVDSLEEQKEFPIDEVFYLIKANSKKELNSQINDIVGSFNERENVFYKSKTRQEIHNNTYLEKDKIFLGDGVAISKVLGIRKVFPLSESLSNIYDDCENPLKDSDYIISSRYKVNSLMDVKRFIKGEIVSFTYLPDDEINLAKNGKLI